VRDAGSGGADGSKIDQIRFSTHIGTAFDSEQRIFVRCPHGLSSSV
jgi:hypothetical protein